MFIHPYISDISAMYVWSQTMYPSSKQQPSNPYQHLAWSRTQNLSENVSRPIQFTTSPIPTTPQDSHHKDKITNYSSNITEMFRFKVNCGYLLLVLVVIQVIHVFIILTRPNNNLRMQKRLFIIKGENKCL